MQRDKSREQRRLARQALSPVTRRTCRRATPGRNGGLARDIVDSRFTLGQVFPS